MEAFFATLFDRFISENYLISIDLSDYQFKNYANELKLIIINELHRTEKRLKKVERQ